MALKSPNINVMQNAIRKAGRALVRDFGELENLQASRDAPYHFAIAADTRTKALLKKELGKARPDFSFLCRGEPTRMSHSGQTWIVGSIDGISNFLHGIPHFSLSVALYDGRSITASTVYQPISDELCWTERGQGAWLNDRRLRVAARSQLSQTVIGISKPTDNMIDSNEGITDTQDITPHVGEIRQMGASALDLTYVAAGRLDGFWGTNLHLCDIAAGTLIVRESGGIVTTTENNVAIETANTIIAANESVHGRLLRLTRNRS